MTKLFAYTSIGATVRIHASNHILALVKRFDSTSLVQDWLFSYSIYNTYSSSIY